ncbi:probable pectinesterase 55 [Beta vulgaris subsp. vulgaris]|uniref:probable pectinesterase 55 n=1 Tax=Beta vulgaris subsp. vulgaris TaxID=3555 RepID=UPI002037682D|nr:probable pectinesterase 55 [Beta vulgaris subsp. vulgaris]
MNSLVKNIIYKFLIIFYCYQFALSLVYNGVPETRTSITVDQSGKGNFTKVQDAINFIPANNSHWIRVHIRAGIYNEKVIIPREKPFIVLEGDGRRKTIIQASDGGTFFQSTTFSLLAANFVARNITFKNIRDHKSDFIWAPAAVITGDKAAFYECGFISLQDTLTDNLGRHYFESCYIQGAVDFIWGDGQSIYQKCTINVTYDLTRTSEVGYITAQARHSANSQSGFVFIRCIILGTARQTYLGRAYTQYSRVLFYNSTLGQVITPEGWSAWSYIGRE